MQQTGRIRFFNFFRNIFRIWPLEQLLAVFTSGKGYDNFFVKCLPQNYQYPRQSFRTVEREGIRYRLDLSEYMEWVIYFGLNVEGHDELYRLIKPGMQLFDIGTNIGETLLNMARLTGPSGRVFGFEPVHENFEKCMTNLALNKFNHVKVRQAALSDKNETLYFGHGANLNSGGIFMTRNSGQDSPAVKAMTLDQVVMEEGLTAVSLLKIDVEGFEYNVLQGGSASIKKYRPLLFVEVDDEHLKRQGVSAEMLESLIKSYGYTIKRAGSGDLHLQHYDLIAIPENETA